MSDNTLTPTIGLEEAAKLLRCHPDTVRKMAAAGELPGTKVGRAWVFYTERLLDWLEKRCAAQQEVRQAPLGSGGSVLAEQLRRLREKRLRRRG
jgi:excisionase family DNA binding protein